MTRLLDALVVHECTYGPAALLTYACAALEVAFDSAWAALGASAAGRDARLVLPIWMGRLRVATNCWRAVYGLTGDVSARAAAAAAALEVGGDLCDGDDAPPDARDAFVRAGPLAPERACAVRVFLAQLDACFALEARCGAGLHAATARCADRAEAEAASMTLH